MMNWLLYRYVIREEGKGRRRSRSSEMGFWDLLDSSFLDRNHCLANPYHLMTLVWLYSSALSVTGRWSICLVMTYWVGCDEPFDRSTTFHISSTPSPPQPPVSHYSITPWNLEEHSDHSLTDSNRFKELSIWSSKHYIWTYLNRYITVNYINP